MAFAVLREKAWRLWLERSGVAAGGRRTDFFFALKTKGETAIPHPPRETVEAEIST